MLRILERTKAGFARRSELGVWGTKGVSEAKGDVLCTLDSSTIKQKIDIQHNERAVALESRLDSGF